MESIRWPRSRSLLENKENFLFCHFERRGEQVHPGRRDAATPSVDGKVQSRLAHCQTSHFVKKKTKKNKIDRDSLLVERPSALL